jgi:hypothetical protein
MTSVRVRWPNAGGASSWKGAGREAGRDRRRAGGPGRFRRHGPLSARLEAQFAFLNEADRLKSVMRATTTGGRHAAREFGRTFLAPGALCAGPGRPGRAGRGHQPGDPDAADPRSGRDRRGRRADPFANGQAHASVETVAAEAKAADRIFGFCPPTLAPTFAPCGRSSRRPKPPTPALPKPGPRAAGDGEPDVGRRDLDDLQRHL